MNVRELAEIKSTARKTAASLGWQPSRVIAFAIELLTDANLHDEAEVLRQFGKAQAQK